MNSLKQIDDALARVEGWLIVALLWVMLVLSFVQICLTVLDARAGFAWANSLIGLTDWAVPLVRIFVLWLAFLGASLLTREGKHIKIDILSPFLPARWMPLREAFLSVVCAGICAFMCKVSIDYVSLEMEYGVRILHYLPEWSAQLILPAGFFIISFRFLMKALEQSIAFVKGEEK